MDGQDHGDPVPDQGSTLGIVPDWGGRQPPPVDEVRCEDAFDFPFGAVVTHRADGRKWAFVGWRRNGAGRYPVFAVDQTDMWKDPAYPTFQAAFEKTLAKHYDGLDRYRRRDAESA